MHKSHQALPKLRTSYPGSIHKPSYWPAGIRYGGLLLCCLLLATGIVKTVNHFSTHRSSLGNSGQLFSVSKDFEPVAAAVAALHSKAAQAAATNLQRQQKQTGSADLIEQLQQGMDSASVGVAAMTRTLPDDSWYSGVNTSAGSAHPHTSFLEANSDIRSTGEAMVRKPLIHGHVVKNAPTDFKHWMHNHTDTRLDTFLSWRINRTRKGVGPAAAADSYTCPAADHPPLPFPGCHVFVNHKYRYIYIRSPKAASTSIVNELGECNNKATRGFNSSTCMVLHFYWNSTELAVDNVQKMWKDYFVFGFVRNPWRRAYSLYKYLHSNGCMPDEKVKDPKCHVPWSTFCTDPWSAAEELHDRGCMKRSKSYLYFHMEDQYHCMRAADGGWAVDFIGRVDDPNDDWAEVINRINANRLPGVRELPVNPLERKNVRAGNIDDPYHKPGADKCFDAVSRLYACDIQHYGFASVQTV